MPLLTKRSTDRHSLSVTCARKTWLKEGRWREQNMCRWERDLECESVWVRIPTRAAQPANLGKTLIILPFTVIRKKKGFIDHGSPPITSLISYTTVAAEWWLVKGWVWFLSRANFLPSAPRSPRVVGARGYRSHEDHSATPCLLALVFRLIDGHMYTLWQSVTRSPEGGFKSIFSLFEILVQSESRLQKMQFHFIFEPRQHNYYYYYYILFSRRGL